MNIAFFVNDVATEYPRFTTTCLARAAHTRGHKIWYIGAEDFAYDPDDLLYARARTVPDGTYRKNETFLQALQRDDAPVERIPIADLDVLLLRSDPAGDDRPWARSVGVVFGQLAVAHGVLVLNNPASLARALNKLYFQFFPEAVRPKTLITRDLAEIRAFAQEQPEKVILKPLQGSGGQGVFLLNTDELANLNQIVETISRDGYVVAQEYLPAAAEGDVRMFLLNGRPLTYKGHYAALHRRCASDDIRSNMHVGGEAVPAKITDAALELAEFVRPQLIKDGMFLVGLDIAGDKLMEVNVFSPGGLHSIERFEEAPFSDLIIEALEEKVAIAARHDQHFGNVQLATM